jgi:hypothetical protein
MKCPFKKVIVTQDRDAMDVTIVKKVTTGFGECYGKECPLYGYNSFGKEWCWRCENDKK